MKYTILVPTGSRDVNKAYVKLPDQLKLNNPRPGDTLWQLTQSAKIAEVHHRHGLAPIVILEGQFRDDRRFGIWDELPDVMVVS